MAWLDAVGIRVDASGDVTVHVASVGDWSTGSYVVLPLDELGHDYYVMTLPLSNQTRALYEVCFVAMADNTIVQFSAASLRHLVNVGIGIDNSLRQSPATFVLQKYQTFQVIIIIAPRPQATNHTMPYISN